LTCAPPTVGFRQLFCFLWVEFVFLPVLFLVVIFGFGTFFKGVTIF
jgi:hypothetical protein